MTNAEAPILWPPDLKSQLTGKDPPDVEKDWGQEERVVTENEMVGWHHRLSWHEFEQLQEIDGETVETVADFIFLCSKITVDGDCSHEIKTLTPWKESYDQPIMFLHIQKQKHYFANKGPSSQSYSFSSGHVWCESWTVKKAECWRSDPFELWCWRRLLRVPWTARRSNQFILKEISLGYTLEGLMLKLKLQYSGHLMQRVDSLEKTLLLGGIGGRRRRGRQRLRRTGKPSMLQPMGSQRVIYNWATEKQQQQYPISPFNSPIPVPGTFWFC